VSYPSNRQTVSPDAVAADQIKAFVRRIEALEDEIRALNGDKSEVYKEAKGNGFDVKVLRKVVAARRQDHSERLEQDALFDLYMEALEGVAHAHVENIEEFDVETGEILETEPPSNGAGGAEEGAVANDVPTSAQPIQEREAPMLDAATGESPVSLGQAANAGGENVAPPPAHAPEQPGTDDGSVNLPAEGSAHSASIPEPATLPTPSGIAAAGDESAESSTAALVVPSIANADRSKPHPFCKDPEECGVVASWEHTCLSCYRDMERAQREGAAA
jgi:uncharacterized protein (UPF0335 family)